MDEFKKYLQHHRDELNSDEPGPQVWQRIQQETASPEKRNVVLMGIRWAAAACVIVLAGIGVWHLAGNNKNTNMQQVAFITQPKMTAPLPETEPQQEQAAAPEKTIAKAAVTPQKHPLTDPALQAQHKAAFAALHNIEKSFTQVINVQRERTSSIPMYAESPAYFSDFKVQIRQFEKDEKAIKSDIARNGVNNELLEQLINLYQQKLNVLKQLQTEMNKLNNRYKQNRTPVDTTKTYFLNI